MKNTTVNLQDSVAGFDSQIFSGPRHHDCLPKPRFVPTFVYVHKESSSWIFPCQMVSIHMKAWHAIDLDGWICCCLARFPKVKVQHSSSTSWKPQTLSTLLSSEWTRKRDRISLLAFGMAIKPTSWSLHCISFLLPPGCCTRVCSRDFMVKLPYLSEVNLSVHHTFEN